MSQAQQSPDAVGPVEVPLVDARQSLGPAKLSDLFPEGDAFRDSLRTFVVLLALAGVHRVVRPVPGLGRLDHRRDGRRAAGRRHHGVRRRARDGADPVDGDHVRPGPPRGAHGGRDRLPGLARDAGHHRAHPCARGTDLARASSTSVSRSRPGPPARTSPSAGRGSMRCPASRSPCRSCRRSRPSASASSSGGSTTRWARCCCSRRTSRRSPSPRASCSPCPGQRPAAR